jgi:hypothetical protein
MHHTDIGRIIEVLEDFFLTTDTPAPITISPIAPAPGDRSSYYGINVVVRWADSQLVAEINEGNKDSNATKLHFYLQATEPKPSLSVQWRPTSIVFQNEPSDLKRQARLVTDKAQRIFLSN